MYNFSTGKEITGTMMIFGGHSITEVAAWNDNGEKTVKAAYWEDFNEEILEPLAEELGEPDLEKWDICWA